MTDLKRGFTSGGVAAARLIAILAAGATLACDDLEETLEGMLVPNLGSSPTDLFEDVAADVFGDDVTVVPDPEQEGRFSLRLHPDADGIDIDLSDLAGWFEEGFAVVEGGMEDGIQFEGNAGEDGWRVRVGAPDSDAVLEVAAHDEGASLSISDASRGVSASLGDESARLPRWVPNYRGTREEQRLFSYTTGSASAGAVLLASDGDPEEISRWYEEELGQDGSVDVSSRASRFSGESEDVYTAWIVAEEDPEGNQASVLIAQDGEESQILVVYKEKR